MIRSLRYLGWVVLAALVLTGPDAARAGFVQTNLVSDIPGLANFTDPNLVNPWGMSASPTSPFWISDQGTGKSTLYNGAGAPQSLVVTIPPPAGSQAGGNPTGQVFNGTSDFQLGGGNKAIFLFATLNGTIAGWNPNTNPTNAMTAVTTPNAVYTGLALANNGAGNFLYAANARGGIDVFDKNFQAATLSGHFTDPNGIPAGFTPYNIQNLGGNLYVTYASRSTAGGVVDVFDANGNFLRRIASNGAGGVLDSPWGLALAPQGFGPFGGDLLVGNKDGDGRISAFDPLTGDFKGQLQLASGAFFSETGLWGLQFGNGGAGGDRDTLYFAAGIQGEAHGLIGSLSVPEPSTILLLGIGGLAAIGFRRRISRRA